MVAQWAMLLTEFAMIKSDVKKEGSVCYVELKCLTWEIVYGVRITDKGEKEEYFEAN